MLIFRLYSSHDKFFLQHKLFDWLWFDVYSHWKMSFLKVSIHQQLKFDAHFSFIFMAQVQFLQPALKVKLTQIFGIPPRNP